MKIIIKLNPWCHYHWWRFSFSYLYPSKWVRRSLILGVYLPWWIKKS